MFNLFDILQSQAGPGMQSIGQQFGLTPEQSQSAMNALLPAIAAGLQRSAASDPMGFSRMLGIAGTQSFTGPGSQPAASTPQDFLAQLFGSPMLSQAVLQQASTASGIGQQALRQMLPVMAGMVVAGIVHVLINQPTQPAATPSSTTTPAFPIQTLWTDWFNQFAGSSGTSQAAPSKAADQPAAPPRSPASQPPVERASADKQEPPQTTLDAPLEAFQQMFQTGVEVQEQNAKAMQDIFDAFWSAPSVPDEVEDASSQPKRGQKAEPAGVSRRTTSDRSGAPKRQSRSKAD